VVVGITSVEEQLRGWLALVKRARNPHELTIAYGLLQQRIESASQWMMLPFDRRAAAEFERLRSLRLRVATLDLRLASIVLANGATLLTRNLRDFRQVPGLQVEDWL
jgi:tRNA(fMet)-specific endonuclease VapC